MVVGGGTLGHPRKKVMLVAKARENGGKLLVYSEDERNSGRTGHVEMANGSSSDEDGMRARWSS